MRTVLILTILIALTASCTHFSPKTTAQDNAVMITNVSKNSGGSGSIIYNSPSQSMILTNRHVCEILKNGGLVESKDKESFVHAFIESEVHDLCLVFVANDLGSHLNIADKAPEMLDTAIVIGHPHLRPLTITEGRFSKKVIVDVVIGTRPCTPEDSADPRAAFMCAFTGQMALVRTYQAIAISSLIQPGSSGSAVLNDAGEIVGVVFAGDGDMSFGLAVPYEYVYNFVMYEAHNLPIQRPNTTR